MDRRQFLKHGLSTSAMGLTFAALPGLGQLSSHVFAADARKPRRVGVIGCGWYGKCDLFRLLQVEPVEVVSMCDVDSQMLSKAAEIVATKQVSKKTPRQYSDYRKLLAEKDLDIAIIGTPDHWHALCMIAAVQAGADVYVQKPTGVDIVESQAMLAAARKHGRVVQVGTQRRSTPHLKEAKELFLDSGQIGKIGHVEIYCYYHMRARGNPGVAQAPAHLDYEMWTGPAPMRPFTPITHPRGWRAFMEYGNGIVGDMCVHMLDTVRWMTNLGWPTRVSSQGGIFVDKESISNISDTQSASFDFPQFTVQWQHRTWGSTPDPAYPWGITYYGENGTLKCSVNSYDYYTNGGQPIHKDVTYELEQFPDDKTEPDLEKHVAPAIRAHMKDFLKAIDERGKPIADIEQGHISSTSCILANLSMELGRSLVWDATKGCVANDAEANAKLARKYREPWIHPTPDNV